jgi:pimeloyl-ACP methyl ester carboxylesterase
VTQRTESASRAPGELESPRGNALAIEQGQVRLTQGEMRFVAEGDPRARPLLLVHSLGTSWHLWEEALPMFAGLGYRAVAPDILGHGDSDKPPFFGFGIRDHALTLVEFMRAIGFKKPCVAGTSLGAQIAIEMGSAWPTMISRLVLNGCPGWEFEEQRMARIQMIARNMLTPDGVPAERDQEQERKLRSGVDLSADKQRQRNIDLQKCGRWFWDTTWATAAYNLHDRLTRISCPTLVLMGESDFHLPTSYTIAHKIPNATMEVLPAPIGHLSPFDDTPAVVASCDRFFRTQLDPLET